MNPNRPPKSARRKQTKAAKKFLAKQSKQTRYSEIYHSMTLKVSQ